MGTEASPIRSTSPAWKGWATPQPFRTLPLDGGTPRVLAYVYGGQGSMNVNSWAPDSRRFAFVSNSAAL